MVSFTLTSNNNMDITPIPSYSNPIACTTSTNGSWVYYYYPYNMNNNSIDSSGNTIYSQNIQINVSSSDLSTYSNIYLTAVCPGGAGGMAGTTDTTYYPLYGTGGCGGGGGGGQVFNATMSLTDPNFPIYPVFPINVLNLFTYNSSNPAPPNGQNWTSIQFAGSAPSNSSEPTNPSENPTLPTCSFGAPGQNGSNGVITGDSSSDIVYGTGGRAGNGGSWNGDAAFEGSNSLTPPPIDYSYNNIVYGTVSGGGGGLAGEDGSGNVTSSLGYSYYGANPVAYNRSTKLYSPGWTQITFEDGLSSEGGNYTVDGVLFDPSAGGNGGICYTKNSQTIGASPGYAGNPGWIMLYMKLA